MTETIEPPQCVCLTSLTRCGWGDEAALFFCLYCRRVYIDTGDMSLTEVVQPTIDDRLTAIETRQREYDMHDPSCTARLIEQAQRHTGAHLVPRDCDCWLAESL